MADDPPVAPCSDLGPLDTLRAAVRIIRTWHSAKFVGPKSIYRFLPDRAGHDAEREAWRLYYRNAPEMAPIRDALGPEGEELGNADPT